MATNDSLGDRMKRFESVTRTSVMRRTPTIIRVDGRAFHTFTQKFKSLDPTEQASPFGEVMHSIMANTATALVQGIQNARMAYVQSDEISILLNDWDRHETEQWFDGTIQKMASISASIATAAFNFGMMQHMEFGNVSQMAQFDARVFNVPMDEVTNYFIWRQQDASRNSVQMLGHFYFSQKELHCKSNPQTQDMLMLQKGINWNDLDVWKKRGSCAYPTHFDTNIPIFTQDREYIERLLRAKDAD